MVDYKTESNIFVWSVFITWCVTFGDKDVISNSAKVYLFKVNNRNTRHNVTDVVLVFLLLTLNIIHTYF